MAHILAERVLETSATTGTGALTLAGAVTGYQAFSAVCSVGDTVEYAIEADSGEWETGVGTYSASNTLTRTSVIASSNANAAVNFPAGDKRVFITRLASRLGVKVDVFTSSGTYVKPSGARIIDVLCIGGGGSGGAGGNNATTNNRFGGSGGYGGAVSFMSFIADQVASSSPVTVGLGGATQPGRSTSGNGASGNSGGATTFGDSTLSGRNIASACLFAGGGGGGGLNTPGYGFHKGGTSGSGASSGGGNAPNGDYTGAGGGGGGGGAGASSTTAANGGAGGAPGGGITHWSGYSSSGQSGDFEATTGVSLSFYAPGGGGAGGGYKTGQNGRSGGAGGLYGGGGGGGAACDSGFTSGSGGAGGNGICVVITRF